MREGARGANEERGTFHIDLVGVCSLEFGCVGGWKGGGQVQGGHWLVRPNNLCTTSPPHKTSLPSTIPSPSCSPRLSPTILLQIVHPTMRCMTRIRPVVSTLLGASRLVEQHVPTFACMGLLSLGEEGRRGTSFIMFACVGVGDRGRGWSCECPMSPSTDPSHAVTPIRLVVLFWFLWDKDVLRWHRTTVR